MFEVAVQVQISASHSIVYLEKNAKRDWYAVKNDLTAADSL